MEFFGGGAGAQTGAYCVADGGPEGLCYEAGGGGEGGVGKTELGGAGFGENDVVGTEETADALPDVGLGYWS